MFVYMVVRDRAVVVRVMASEGSATGWVEAQSDAWRFTVERRRVWFASEVAEEIAEQRAMMRVTSKEEV